MLKWLEISKNRWVTLIAALGVFFLVAWMFFAQIPTENPPNSALGLTLLFSLKYLALTKAADMVRVSHSIAIKVFVGMALALLVFDTWLYWAVFTAPPEQADVGFALYAFSFFLVVPVFLGYLIICAIFKRLTK